MVDNFKKIKKIKKKGGKKLKGKKNDDKQIRFKTLRDREARLGIGIGEQGNT